MIRFTSGQAVNLCAQRLVQLWFFSRPVNTSPSFNLNQ
jgi:hypothetical protein